MTEQRNYTGYCGTYTKGDSKGIYSFRLDTETRKIVDVKVVAELENPTYVTINRDHTYLYSVIKRGDQGGAASYAINQATGELTFVNDQLSTGASPCHISVDSSNQHVVTANYHKGTIELYPVHQSNGTLAPSTSVMEHQGSGPNPDRQEKPHTHFSGFTPDEKYVIAVDLGIDQLITYERNGNSLTEKHTLSVKPGSGPRHITFHPNGKYAYLMTELSSEVIVLSYDAESGRFSELQYISAIPIDFEENNQGSAIHISSDGRFVYAANRGHNSIALYRVDPNTGELTFVEHTSTEGDWPRDFAMDPTERFLVASNQESGTLVLFVRDGSTGKLTLLQKDVSVPYAVCVKFL